MSRASFSIQLCIDARNRPVIALVDRCVGRTITNDAENVIRDFVQAGIDVDAYRFVYCDTDGVWDELVVRNGVFAGFVPLRAQDLAAALGLPQVSQ